MLNLAASNKPSATRFPRLHFATRCEAGGELCAIQFTYGFTVGDARNLRASQAAVRGRCSLNEINSIQ